MAAKSGTTASHSASIVLSLSPVVRVACQGVAPSPCRLRWAVNAPSRSCRRSPASLGHRTESVGDRSPVGASQRRRGRCRTRSRATPGAHGARGRTRAWSTRRSRQPHEELAGRVHHWMISSARTRIDCGIVNPSTLAVVRLMTSSNLVG